MVELRRPRVGARLFSRALVLTLVALCTLAVACRQPVKRPNLPAAVEVTTVGVGDVFELRIVGEDKLPTEYVVAPDGTVDLPYIHRVTVAGLEPQQISALVRDKLQEKKILTDPSVSVNVKAYNSKRVEVLGEVKKPGSLPLEPGMTLLRAISKAGGFNSLADKSNVTVRRKVKNGTKSARVDVTGILENLIPDVPLQAGDSIHVGQRVF